MLNLGLRTEITKGTPRNDHVADGPRIGTAIGQNKTTKMVLKVQETNVHAINRIVMGIKGKDKAGKTVIEIRTGATSGGNLLRKGFSHRSFPV